MNREQFIINCITTAEFLSKKKKKKTLALLARVPIDKPPVVPGWFLISQKNNLFKSYNKHCLNIRVRWRESFDVRKVTELLEKTFLGRTTLLTATRTVWLVLDNVYNCMIRSHTNAHTAQPQKIIFSFVFLFR